MNVSEKLHKLLLTGVALMSVFLIGCETVTRMADGTILIPQASYQQLIMARFQDLTPGKIPPSKDSFGPGETPMAFVIGHGGNTITLRTYRIADGQMLLEKTAFVSQGNNWFQQLNLPTGSYKVSLVVGGTAVSSSNFSVDKGANNPPEINKRGVKFESGLFNLESRWAFFPAEEARDFNGSGSFDFPEEYVNPGKTSYSKSKQIHICCHGIYGKLHLEVFSPSKEKIHEADATVEAPNAVWLLKVPTEKTPIGNYEIKLTRNGIDVGSFKFEVTD